MLGVSQGVLGFTFTLLGSSKLSEVTKALNQDLQLGPGEPNFNKPLLCDAEKVTKQKYIVYKAGLFALQTRCEDNRKVAGRQNPLFCFVPVLLRI